MRIKQLAANSAERCFAVVLDDGEEATAQLLSFAQERHVTAATFVGLGAFSRVTLGFFELERKDYRHIELNEQVELVSMVGNLATQNAQPRLHCHVAVANREGKAFGGHLLKAHVRPTLELIVTDVPAHLRRATDSRTGLPLLIP